MVNILLPVAEGVAHLKLPKELPTSLIKIMCLVTLWSLEQKDKRIKKD